VAIDETVEAVDIVLAVVINVIAAVVVQLVIGGKAMESVFEVLICEVVIGRQVIHYIWVVFDNGSKKEFPLGFFKL